MREIVLDTETTGLHLKDNRIIEIGALEIIEGIETGNYFHTYLNPQMPISSASQRICGITDDMVKNAALFENVAQEFLDFISDSPIIAHNAQFDIKFLNKELNIANRGPIKNSVIDTLKIARSIFKNNNSLDALCKRFKINLSARVAQGHGALLDSQLLVKVLYYLRNAQTHSLQDYIEINNTSSFNISQINTNSRIVLCSAEEQQKHKQFCNKYNINFTWANV